MENLGQFDEFEKETIKMKSMIGQFNSYVGLHQGGVILTPLCLIYLGIIFLMYTSQYWKFYR